MNGRWLPFPSRAASILDVAPEGLALRNATDDDLPFLRRVYADSRAEELAAVSWPDAILQPFLDSQFLLQHTHYVTHFSQANFFVVESRDNPAGRFYVDDRDENLHVVDISLLIGEQGKGHGAALMRSLMSQATRMAKGVTLQVSSHNARAQSFYRRLGFCIVGESDSHLAMRWIS